MIRGESSGMDWTITNARSSPGKRWMKCEESSARGVALSTECVAISVSVGTEPPVRASAW
jgi:hypothetical protein